MSVSTCQVLFVSFEDESVSTPTLLLPSTSSPSDLNRILVKLVGDTEEQAVYDFSYNRTRLLTKTLEQELDMDEQLITLYYSKSKKMELASSYTFGSNIRCIRHNLVGLNDGSIKDLQSGTLHSKVHAAAVSCVQRLGEGILSGSLNCTLHLTDKKTRNLRTFDQTVQCLSREQSGITLIGLWDGTVVAWDIGRKNPEWTKQLHQGPILFLDWINETTFCTASWDHTIRLWEYSTRTQLSLVNCGHVISCGTRTQGHLAFGHPDGRIRILDSTLEKANLIEAHDGRITSLTSSTTQLISSGEEGLVKFWNPSDPTTPHRTIKLPDRGAAFLDFYDDKLYVGQGSRLLIYSDVN